MLKSCKHCNDKVVKYLFLMVCHFNDASTVNRAQKGLTFSKKSFRT